MYDGFLLLVAVPASVLFLLSCVFLDGQALECVWFSVCCVAGDVLCPNIRISNWERAYGSEDSAFCFLHLHRNHAQIVFCLDRLGLSLV